jgi:acyl-CoA thioester hydrolase
MSKQATGNVLFFAPFVSSTMRVEPQWIDYNGHLNMAYYHVLFDRAVEEAFALVGLGADYLATKVHPSSLPRRISSTSAS